MAKVKTVYLITTKDVKCDFHIEPNSQIDLFPENNNSMWNILMEAGSFFDKIISPEVIVNIVSNFDDVDEVSRDATCNDIIDSIVDGPATCFFQKDINAIKPSIAKFLYNNEKEINGFINLFGYIQKIQTADSDIDVYITHNWYSRFGSVNNNEYFYSSKPELKYRFITCLIGIIKREYTENIDLRLFLHDKDIVDSGVVDRLATINDIDVTVKNEFTSKLSELISQNKVYLFQHETGRYKERFWGQFMINIQNLSEAFFAKFLQEREELIIRQELTNKPPYMEICIPERTTDSNLTYCTDCEIIEAVANYQAGNGFAVRNIKNHEVFSKLEEDLPIVIYSNKPISEIDDKRNLYLDSSIWLQYINREEPETPPLKFSETNYYTKSNAQESREFNARMCLNSYLEPFGGGHSGSVVPFVFHSESDMKIKADTIISSKKDSKKGGLKDFLKIEQQIRRVLLIDDNAINNQGDDKKVHKFNVIKAVLKDFNVVNITDGEIEKTEDADKPTLLVEYVKTINEAKECLRQKRYDVILLDYLLDHKNVSDKSKGREYGTELLEIINKKDKIDNDVDEEIKANKGPLGKYWIFFISAFSNTISAQMLSKGLHYNDECWHIARGACPTTTPELFRYNFYSLLLRQLQELTDIKLKKTEDDKKVITLIDLLSYIFDDATEIKKRAIDNFNSLLNLRAHYDVLKNDFYMGGKKNAEAKNNGSPLVQSLFPDIKHYSNAFWEHVQHLIYLIAFGNIRQWNEMWDEYVFIKDLLKEAAIEAKSDGLHTRIEEYIYNIKSENY